MEQHVHSLLSHGILSNFDSIFHQLICFGCFSGRRYIEAQLTTKYSLLDNIEETVLPVRTDGFVLTSSINTLNNTMRKYFSIKMTCDLMCRLNRNSFPHSEILLIFFRLLLTAYLQHINFIKQQHAPYVHTCLNNQSKE